MKCIILFKTPDAIEYALQPFVDQIRDEVCDEEQEVQFQELEVFKEFVGQFVEFGEVVRIEFDSNTKTATVLEI